MRIGIIPPGTHTGEYKYGQYLVQGLLERGLTVDLYQNPLLVKSPNLKVFLGSWLLDHLIDEKVEILHNLDNLGPFFKNDHNSCKRISTIHDLAPVVLPGIHSPIMNFDFKWVLPRLVDNSHLILADSHSTKQDLQYYFGVEPEKIRVVHLGVNLSLFYPHRSPTRVLENYGVRGEYLFYLGDDNPRKNIHNLIRAYNLIQEEVEQDLVLVGPLNQHKLRSFIEKLDKGNGLSQRIITPGYVDNHLLPLFYSYATALVFPSLYEGFGFAPLEAMACGTPVIVPRHSSLPEVVGSTGLYVEDPRDPLQIAEGILILLDDDQLQRKLQREGPRQAEQFPWENTVNRTIAAYQESLEM